MTFAQVVSNIVIIVNAGVVPLLFSLGILFFMISIVRFFFIEGGEEGQTKGKKALLYGAIGLCVLFSVWGIVNILLNTLSSITGTPSTTTSTTNSPNTTTSP